MGRGSGGSENGSRPGEYRHRAMAPLEPDDERVVRRQRQALRVLLALCERPPARSHERTEASVVQPAQVASFVIGQPGQEGRAAVGHRHETPTVLQDAQVGQSSKARIAGAQDQASAVAERAEVPP